MNKLPPRKLKRKLRDAIFFINKNPLSKFLYNGEISKRANLNLNQIIPLSKHIQLFSPFTNEIHPANDWYGHAKVFKKYLNLDRNYQFKFIIEHGSYTTEQISEAELEQDLPSFITSNEYRVKIFKKISDSSFSIGPYIHYAQNIYSREKIDAEKKRLGKNILIFPAHSLNFIIQDYDGKWFMNNVKKIAKDFQNIRICLYWADIQLGIHKYYENLGFECVSAGHILDPFFLPRLKTLIEISDLTISNDVGTHVGYCTYLNKKHIIFHKIPKIKTNKKWAEFTQEYWSSTPYQEILNEFSKTTNSITTKQREISNKYYGGKNDIKNPTEFKKIVDLTEKTYQKLINYSF